MFNEHLRILVSARPYGSEPDDWLSRLGWSGKGITQKFSLSNLARNGVAEALAQMGYLLAPLAHRLDLVETIFSKSEGDPLVTALYISSLAEYVNNPQTLDVGRLERIEPGLRGFFRSWLADQVQIWGTKRHKTEPKIRALLESCAIAHGPLTCEDLRGLNPSLWDSRDDINDSVYDLRRFVEVSRVDDQDGYVMGHSRFSEFVREEINRSRAVAGAIFAVRKLYTECG